MSTEAILFLKYPEPGKVKTRLAATIGNELAADVYRRLAEKNITVLKSFATKTQTRLVAAYTPTDRKSDFIQWLGLDWDFRLQAGSDLGERMATAFQMGFARKANFILALGSDTLELDKEILLQALKLLQEKDMVIGPAQDGGYYLIGMSRDCTEVFQNIEWSTDRVLMQTEDVAKQRGYKIGYLKTLNDLDEIDQMPNWLRHDVGISQLEDDQESHTR